MAKISDMDHLIPRKEFLDLFIPTDPLIIIIWSMLNIVLIFGVLVFLMFTILNIVKYR
jgi:hypothetical protein